MKNETISLLSLLLLFVCGLQLSAQDGSIKFTISPKDAFVRIDGNVLEVSKQNTLRLVPGNYEIEVWAPRFEIFKQTITITAGEQLDYRKGLTILATDFGDYRETDDVYRKAKLNRNITLGSILLANAITTVSYRLGLESNIDGLKKQADEARRNYERAIDQFSIDLYANAYATLRAEYNAEIKRRDNFTKIATPALLLSYGVSAFFVVKLLSKKIDKPSYAPENPFLSLINKYQPSLMVSNNQLGLGINLKF